MDPSVTHLISSAEVCVAILLVFSPECTFLIANILMLASFATWMGQVVDMKGLHDGSGRLAEQRLWLWLVLEVMDRQGRGGRVTQPPNQETQRSLIL